MYDDIEKRYVRLSRTCVHEKHIVAKGNVGLASYVLDIIQEVSSMECKLTRIILMNPKGIFDVGKDAKPGALFQAGFKMFVGAKITGAIEKAMKLREKQGDAPFADELHLIEVLNLNKQHGVSK